MWTTTWTGDRKIASTHFRTSGIEGILRTGKEMRYGGEAVRYPCAVVSGPRRLAKRRTVLDATRRQCRRQGREYDADDDHAAQLLADTAADLTEPLRRRVIEESAGNPLALLELPMTEGLPSYEHSPLPLPERLRLAYAARIGMLPADAKTALPVAALADDGDLTVVTAACAELGVPRAAIGTVERSGLAGVADRRLRFSHPLIRAATLQLSTYDLRQNVHRILAWLLVDRPDQHAWHLAAAATGPDETAAQAMEDLAIRAKERGALLSACVAFERAADLSEDRARKGRRLLAAASQASDEEQLSRAQRLLTAASSLVPDASAHATFAMLRGRVAFGQGAPDLAHELLLSGAAEPADHALMLIEAARNADLLGDAEKLVEAAARLSALDLRPEDDLDLARQAAVSKALLLTEGPAAALPVMRELVTMSRHITGEMSNRRINAAHFARHTGDFQAAWEIFWTAAQECRAAGEIGKLVIRHVSLATSEIFLGRFGEAEATASEGLRLITETDRSDRAGGLHGMLAWLAAARGDARECDELATAAQAQHDADGIVNGMAWAQWARALLDLGEGRFAEVLDRLDAAMAGPMRHQFHAVHVAP